MRYQPTELENQLIPGMSRVERMDYFLNRATESEEIWSLGNAEGWLIGASDEHEYIRVWNYQSLATACLDASHAGYEAQSVSLERFVDELLPIMISLQLQIEIFPTPNDRGALMHAAALFEILDRKVDGETYFVEG